MNSDEEPVSGARVTIIFSLWEGVDTEYTDDDGWAEFSYEPIDEDKKMFVKDIYIDGERVDGDFYMGSGGNKSYSI